LRTAVDVDSGPDGSRRAEVCPVGNSVAVDVRVTGIPNAIEVKVCLRGIRVRWAVVSANAECAGLSRITIAVKVAIDLALRTAVDVHRGGRSCSRTGVAGVAHAVAVGIELVEVGSGGAVIRTRAERAEAAWIADSVAVGVHLLGRAATAVNGRGRRRGGARVTGVAHSVGI
jgi:hypothetical protein